MTELLVNAAAGLSRCDRGCRIVGKKLDVDRVALDCPEHVPRASLAQLRTELVEQRPGFVELTEHRERRRAEHAQPVGSLFAWILPVLPGEQFE